MRKEHVVWRCVIAAMTLFFIIVATAGASGQQISGVSVFQQKVVTTDTQTIIIEVSGINLSSKDEQPRVIVFPPVDAVTLISTPTEANLVRAQFTAPKDYSLREVALSYASGTKTREITPTTCNKDTDIISDYNFVGAEQVKSKYGNGVQKNFYVLQLSIVNKCPLALVVPLAGIKISAAATSTTPSGQQKPTPGGGVEEETATAAAERGIAGNAKTLVPFSLDHVTSVYSTDRKLTGARAIGFNILQAVATLGSSIEPFFGHGFTQGVSILGGGFTNAAQTIFKDMSAEQLQNITTQSFATAEQIGPNGGSVNKFLFIPKKLNDQTMDDALKTGQVMVTFESIVAIATTTSQATQAPSGSR